MHEPELGKKGTMNAMRRHLQSECGMLQVWAGKTSDDDDYVTFISNDLSFFAVLSSDKGTREYTVSTVGDVIFMHEKNLKELAENALRY